MVVAVKAGKAPSAASSVTRSQADSMFGIEQLKHTTEPKTDNRLDSVHVFKHRLAVIYRVVYYTMRS